MIEHVPRGATPKRPPTNAERLAEFLWKYSVYRPVPFNTFPWKPAK